MRLKKLFTMKKLFTLLLLLAGLSVSAQQYNNEWIRFNQTYYKFKVGKDGLFRIPKTTLDAWGIGNTQVQFLNSGEMGNLFHSILQFNLVHYPPMDTSSSGVK